MVCILGFIDFTPFEDIFILTPIGHASAGRLWQVLRLMVVLLSSGLY